MPSCASKRLGTALRIRGNSRWRWCWLWRCRYTPCRAWRVFDVRALAFQAVAFKRVESGQQLRRASGVLPLQAVQRGLLGAVALVVKRGAIRRQPELRHRGLYARLSEW